MLQEALPIITANGDGIADTGALPGVDRIQIRAWKQFMNREIEDVSVAIESTETSGWGADEMTIRTCEPTSMVPVVPRPP